MVNLWSLLKSPLYYGPKNSRHQIHCHSRSFLFVSEVVGLSACGWMMQTLNVDACRDFHISSVKPPLTRARVPHGRIPQKVHSVQGRRRTPPLELILAETGPATGRLSPLKNIGALQPQHISPSSLLFQALGSKGPCMSVSEDVLFLWSVHQQLSRARDSF